MEKEKIKKPIVRPVKIFSSELLPFTYNDIHLTECYWLEGKPYFTGLAIGLFFGYQHDTAEVMVDAISQQISSIYFKAFTLKVTLNRSNNKILLYDIIALLILFFESSEKDNAYLKVKVLELLSGYFKLKITQPTPMSTERKLALVLFSKFKDMPKKKRAKALLHLAQEIGVSKATVYRWKNQYIEHGKLFYRYKVGWEKRKSKEE